MQIRPALAYTALYKESFSPQNTLSPGLLKPAAALYTSSRSTKIPMSDLALIPTCLVLT